jgi:hypothetical protein
MMMNLHEMECRGKDDAILAKKIDRIKEKLKGLYPEMDDRFWDKIRLLDRPRLTRTDSDDPWANTHPTLPPLPKMEESKSLPIGNAAYCLPRHRTRLLFRHCR